MKIVINKSYILDEKEIKSAIRKHLYDIIGTSAINIKEEEIELRASVNEDFSINTIQAHWNNSTTETHTP